MAMSLKAFMAYDAVLDVSKMAPNYREITLARPNGSTMILKLERINVGEWYLSDKGSTEPIYRSKTLDKMYQFIVDRYIVCKPVNKVVGYVPDDKRPKFTTGAIVNYDGIKLLVTGYNPVSERYTFMQYNPFNELIAANTIGKELLETRSEQVYDLKEEK